MAYVCMNIYHITINGFPFFYVVLMYIFVFVFYLANVKFVSNTFLF